MKAKNSRRPSIGRNYLIKFKKNSLSKIGVKSNISPHSRHLVWLKTFRMNSKGGKISRRNTMLNCKDNDYKKCNRRKKDNNNKKGNFFNSTKRYRKKNKCWDWDINSKNESNQKNKILQQREPTKLERSISKSNSRGYKKKNV